MHPLTKFARQLACLVFRVDEAELPESAIDIPLELKKTIKTAKKKYNLNKRR